MPARYDAVLLVSFGGPEGMDDVMPFLANVVRGRNVPPERLQKVAANYEHFGGKSPLPEQCRALAAALRQELAALGPELPVYLGNRNWHPFLADALRQMAKDGVSAGARVLHLRLRLLLRAAASTSRTSRRRAPRWERARPRSTSCAPSTTTRASSSRRWSGSRPRSRSCRSRGAPRRASSSPRTACRERSRRRATTRPSSRRPPRSWPFPLGRQDYSLVYQSRSGPPGQPWLEPDIVEQLRALAQAGARDVVVAPIGFLSDHMEVVYDLDLEARSRALELGLQMVRASTVGTHPALRAHDPRAPGRAHRGRSAAAAPRHARPRARRVRRGLLPRAPGARVSVVLFTGFPGFIGMRLLPLLLERQPDLSVACLVQEKFQELARRSLAELQAAHPHTRGRLELVVGDITQPGLGIAPGRAAGLQRSLRQLWHLAAVYDLAVARELAWRVNVEGTRQVLAFAAGAPGFERLQYVSTAYVSGTARGVFRETDLDVGQGFKNHYEATKFEAEVAVVRSGLPATIYRPGLSNRSRE